MTFWVATGTLVGIAVASLMIYVLQAIRRLAEQLDEQRIGAGVLEAATTHAIFATDRDGVITLFSRGAEHMLGYTAREVVGRLTPESFYLRDEIVQRGGEMGVAGGFEVLARIAAAKLSTPQRWTVVHRSGRRIPVLLSLRPLTDRRGRTTGCVGVGRDISCELRLQSERDQFFSLPIEMLCVVDMMGRFLDVNRMFQVCLGYSFEQMVGQPLFDFIHPDDQEITRQELRGLHTRATSPTKFINRYRHVDGSYRWLSWVSSPDVAAGRIYGAARDITEQRRLEAALQDRLLFKKQLLGIVSHDLRNPIAAILMSVRHLRAAGPKDAKLARGLARIESAASRSERLVLDLLDFTRAQLGGGMEVAPEEHDLVRLGQEVAHEVAAAHPERRIALTGAKRASCKVDAHRIAQALTNLLVNALHHGDAQQPVTVRIEAERAQICLIVHNFGPPIAPEAISSLFTPMRQSGEGGTKAPGSLGLGLFIVEQVGRAHGGSVEVDSRREAGTRFIMRVPRLRPAASAAD